MTSDLFSPDTISAAAFDHDGTLVNSLPAVVASTNATLVEAGFPEVPASEIIAAMVLPTAPRLGHHAGVSDPALQTTMAERFYVHAAELFPSRCQLYPGVLPMLETLAARGLPMAVISNNEGALIRRIMQQLGILRFFTTVLGEEDMPAPKPDPRGLLHAAERMQREPWWCVFVGDSSPDRLVARNAGMRSIGVTWGIHPRAEMEGIGFDVLVDRPEDITALIALLR